METKKPLGVLVMGWAVIASTLLLCVPWMRDTMRFSLGSFTLIPHYINYKLFMLLPPAFGNVLDWSFIIASFIVGTGLVMHSERARLFAVGLCALSLISILVPIRAVIVSASATLAGNWEFVFNLIVQAVYLFVVVRARSRRSSDMESVC